jgi:class 3 adenylate cyclase/YHS domain-containing protein
MEKEVSMLIADLSGYTALTETHGSTSAANLIEKYEQIVQNCLVGNCNLCERRGDEVMIVSDSADMLLTTALQILQKTAMEPNFLQVHGGLHFGKILNRNGHYYGSTLNITARIAAKALPGTFWCSDIYIRQLKEINLNSLHSMGKHQFKNVSGETELHELRIEENASFWIDPICRMLILNKSNSIPHPASPSIFFCSVDCLNIYMSHPAMHLTDNF